MFTVVVWDVKSLSYIVKFDGSFVECEDWVNTKRMIGDRKTYLIRK